VQKVRLHAPYLEKRSHNHHHLHLLFQIVTTATEFRMSMPGGIDEKEITAAPAYYPPQPSAGPPPQTPNQPTTPAPNYDPNPPQQQRATRNGVGVDMGTQFKDAQCARGIHAPVMHYGVCGIIAAICLFPFGLIFLLVDRERRCARCGQWLR